MTKHLKTRICNQNDKKHLPFLKSYKFLYQDKNYQDLPYQSKAMYTHIANKQMRILKSNVSDLHIDSNGQRFVTYPITELEHDLKLSNSSAKKYKRILIEYGLISTKNNGKHIYVHQPKLTDDSLTYDNGKKLSYFHMPKFFETNPNYKNASLLTRLVYTLQKERFTLTLANVTPKKPSKYIDESGRVYCIYANQALAKMLNVCEKSIIKAKKELEALGLLKQRQQSIDEPNRLYLYTPLCSEQLTTDTILDDNQDNKTDKKYVLVPPEKSIGGCVYKKQGFKYTVGKGLNMQSSNTDFSNTDYSNTYNSIYSMYSMYSMYISNNLLSDTNDTQDNFESTRKEMKLQPFNFDKVLNQYLMNFNSMDLGIVLKKLVTAKNNYNKNYDTNFTLEDINDELLKMLKRVKVTMHDKDKTIANMGGYIYQSTINELKAYEIKQIEQQSDSDETVGEFEARWFAKIQDVSNQLQNNQVDCQMVKFEHDNNTLGYQDEKGVPY